MPLFQIQHILYRPVHCLHSRVKIADKAENVFQLIIIAAIFKLIAITSVIALALLKKYHILLFSAQS